MKQFRVQRTYFKPDIRSKTIYTKKANDKEIVRQQRA